MASTQCSLGARESFYVGQSNMVAEVLLNPFRNTVVAVVLVSTAGSNDPNNRRGGTG